MNSYAAHVYICGLVENYCLVDDDRDMALIRQVAFYSRGVSLPATIGLLRNRKCISVYISLFSRYGKRHLDGEVFFTEFAQSF